MKRCALFVLIVVLVACTGDGVQTVQPYDRAPVPFVPDRTAPIDAKGIAADGSLTNVTDGDYWAQASAVGSGVPFIMFDLSQAFFAQRCVDEFSEQQCVDGYGVRAEPHGTLTVLWDDLQSVTVVGESRQNYAVPGAELASLVATNINSADAPPDYDYMPYPFLVTVRDGQIVDVHQIWVPLHIRSGACETEPCGEFVD